MHKDWVHKDGFTLLWIDGQPVRKYAGPNPLQSAHEHKQFVKLEPPLGPVGLGRRIGLDLITIMKSRKLLSSDPPETLPPGQYMQFESLEDPTEFLLFSKCGRIYRVKKKDLNDAIGQGYVKA